jgi:hypothetical protein
MPEPSKDNVKLKNRVPNPDASVSDDQPTKPLEPTGNAQPEIPKVGTKDAPGG